MNTMNCRFIKAEYPSDHYKPKDDEFYYDEYFYIRRKGLNFMKLNNPDNVTVVKGTNDAFNLLAPITPTIQYSYMSAKAKCICTRALVGYKTAEYIVNDPSVFGEVMGPYLDALINNHFDKVGFKFHSDEKFVGKDFLIVSGMNGNLGHDSIFRYISDSVGFEFRLYSDGAPLKHFETIVG